MICRICKVDKPQTEFYVRETGKLRTECKDCLSKLHHELYLKRRIERLLYAKNHHAQNKDEINTDNRERYRKNINNRRVKLLLSLNPNYFKALERDQFICQLCKRADSKNSRLLVHHINGDRTDNKLDNLMTLCTPCHTIITWMAKIWVTDSTIGNGTNIEPFTFIRNCTIGERNVIRKFCNIYNSTIGNDNKIAAFVEIGGAKIESNNKIEAMVFIPLGVTIGNNCFIGPGVKFANDKYPQVVDDKWEWTLGKIDVGDYVAIGIGSIILPNVKIGEHTFIAADSLVVSDIPPHSFVMGRPAHVVSLQVLKELKIL